jgi:dGTPase
LPGGVFVHNRLTHSLEVASVGRSLGNNLITLIKSKNDEAPAELIEQIPTIVSTACLAHDLGNPPFGHSGEDAIRAYFIDNESSYRANLSDEQWNDLIRFEGNANALRLLSQKMEGKREGGFRLSYPTLGSIVKYPWESTMPGKKKFGFFQTEKDWYKQIAQEMGIPKNSDTPLGYSRHPLVYLVEAADDICYQIMDIEDAHKLGILPTSEVKSLFLAFFDGEKDKNWLVSILQTLTEVVDKNEQIAFLRAMAIGKLISECSRAFEYNYSSIMNGVHVSSLIDQLDETGRNALANVKQVSIEKVYNHKPVVEIELAGYKILNTLLHRICPAILNPKSSYSKQILKIIPQQYLPNMASDYERLMAAVDFVSGMTDVHALEMYQTFEGISIPGINR